MKGIDSPSLDPLEAGKRGKICLFPSFVNQNKICQLQGRLPSTVPAHGKQTNMRTLCFFRWWGAPRLWSWKSEALWEISCGVCLGPMLEWCWRSFFPSSTWHTKGRVNNSTFRVARGLSILVGQNWADNGYVHEYCSRTCFEGCEIWEPSTLPPMCVWSFWRNSLLRRLMWKRTSERRLRTLVIAVHWHFTSSGMSMYKEGSTDNFHDSSVFERVDISSIVNQMSHFFFWQMTFFFFFFFFFEIEILIRIALFWWSGFSPLIFSTKRRRVSRVMLEGRNGQTRGRLIRRRGKQRERLKPGLAV